VRTRGEFAAHPVIQLVLVMLDHMRMLQLADSALPIGGYAFSAGLEALAKMGLVQTRSDFIHHLETVIAEAGGFDLRFMHSFYHTPEVDDAWIEYDALLTIPAIRRASTTQGRGLLRFFTHTPVEDCAEIVRARVKATRTPPHYLPALTVCLKSLTVPLPELSGMYLFGIVRDQISAAIRLGLIGPLEGHRLQFHMHAACAATIAGGAGQGYETAFRSAPALEIAQASHSRVYSRLFQN
jgi:urease accessory protein